jgi:hypothetical protein
VTDSTSGIQRREFESDPVEAGTVTLAEPIVRSLQDEHFVCLNHALIHRGRGAARRATKPRQPQPLINSKPA